jgi:hypothetical protein
MCDSSGPFPLRFAVEVGGVQATSGCRSTITFYSDRIETGNDPRPGDVRQATTYAVRMTIRSVSPDGDPRASRRLTVEALPDADRRPASAASSSPGTATVVSDLAAPGGAGQVVLNGEAAFPREGRSPLAVRVRRGENRVEATLVESRGQGTWRFSLEGVAGLQPESLRVVAGDVLQVGGGAIAFRLRGRPGERLVFTFRVEP